MNGSVTKEGDMGFIRIPVDEVHSLRVALTPIRAGETVSISTQNIRVRLDKALARVTQPKG